MHGVFFPWWKHAHRHWHGEARHAGGCGPGARDGDAGEGARFGGPFGGGHGGPFGGGHGGGDPGDWGGGGFGVRRPLRFLAHKLELDDEQVAGLAAILDDLKTERAQAAVDDRRATASIADVLGAATFDETRATEVKEARVASQERLQAAVARALGRIHALLGDEQRKKLAYLIRSGALSI